MKCSPCRMYIRKKIFPYAIMVCLKPSSDAVIAFKQDDQTTFGDLSKK